MATAETTHRSTWRKVSRFLAVSDFVATKLKASGIPPENVRVVPNGAVDPGPPSVPGSGFVFVGRLSPEKGVDLLLEAWRLARLGPDTRLRIVGDGPQRSLVEQAATRMSRSITAVPAPRNRWSDPRRLCRGRDSITVLRGLPSAPGTGVRLPARFSRQIWAPSPNSSTTRSAGASPAAQKLATALRTVDRRSIEDRSEQRVRDSSSAIQSMR